MLLTMTATATGQGPATDLGYLLGKNPARCQSFGLSFGQAHVFYPEATAARCSVALLLDLDPIGLVRGRGPGSEAGALAHYVNDRPYVASSFLSVAIARVFGTALKGGPADRAALAAQRWPLEIHLPVLPCRGGDALLRQLFVPLGYNVRAQSLPLDETMPAWGASDYYDVTLQIEACLADVLTHLYVLLPVLDNDKHYWVGQDELNKLLERGAGWLAGHPARDIIVQRYLRRQRNLAREAVSRLAEAEPQLAEPAEGEDSARPNRELALERGTGLNAQRTEAVVRTLQGLGARRVVDVGCGEGRLLQALLREKEFTQLTGVDVAWRVLQQAGERLKLDQLPQHQRERIHLFQGALTYRDARLHGFDAACLIEVIEHLDAGRLPALERVIFEYARPRHVVVTTPNVEYNPLFATLEPGTLRHPDHRFEWTRSQFATWAHKVAERFAYSVQFFPVGPEDPVHGAPTQMGVFSPCN